MIWFPGIELNSISMNYISQEAFCYHSKHTDTYPGFTKKLRHSGSILFQLLFGRARAPPDDYSLVQRQIPLRHSWCWVHCCFRGVTSSSLQFRASSPNLKIRGYLYSFSLSQISCVNYIASEKLTCSRVSSLSPLLDGPSCPAVRSRSGSA